MTRLELLFGTAPLRPEVGGRTNDDGTESMFVRQADGTLRWYDENPETGEMEQRKA